MNSKQNKFHLKYLIHLSKYIDARITVNGAHSFQVAHLGCLTAEFMNYPKSEIRSLYWASLLHDIGKISIPDEVLIKCGPLSDREWLIMKLHPIISANIVTELSSLSDTVPLIAAHQEKYDGNGYPYGLVGEKIPFGARILSVIDAFDAMTNDRVYKKAFNDREAINELRENKGTHFDPDIVDCFIHILKTNNIRRTQSTQIK